MDCFGEDSQIKAGKCDLWRDPQNDHNGAISPHERCSALISADKMLHIKEEGKREPARVHTPPKCFDVSI